MYRIAVEKANQLLGGWPEDEAVIAMLEGLVMPSPGGYTYIRPDNHQAYKDGITGISRNVPDYPFQILDPKRITTVPIRNITAPPGWKKVEPTAAYTWVNETWPSVGG
jgi:branched-chain amino acid transport system substrate-binding protein